jgi:hypothetical protein
MGAGRQFGTVWLLLYMGDGHTHALCTQIRLNQAFRGKLAGKVIGIIDDFLTMVGGDWRSCMSCGWCTHVGCSRRQGNTFETIRNILAAEGVKRVRRVSHPTPMQRSLVCRSFSSQLARAWATRGSRTIISRCVCVSESVRVWMTPFREQEYTVTGNLYAGTYKCALVGMRTLDGGYSQSVRCCSQLAATISHTMPGCARVSQVYGAARPAEMTTHRLHLSRFCTALKCGCCLSLSSSKSIDSLVVRNAPECRIRCTTSFRGKAPAENPTAQAD